MSGERNEIQDFFESCAHFPSIESESIDTIEFLNACKSVVKFVELLGSAFIPVRHDMNGNIDKINKIFESDRQKYKYLDLIVNDEKQSLPELEFHIGTDALIWLTRALNYNLIFLTLLLVDFEEGKRNEDLSDYFAEAYEHSLKNYHNWFVQKICSLCLLSAPNRSTLLKLLSKREPIDEQLLFTAIKRYTDCLRTNIETINKTFSDLQINYM